MQCPVRRSHCQPRLRSLAAAALFAVAATAFSQTYPARPIRLIVAYPPGGASDTLARIVSPRLSSALGQQVVIDNRTGAAGNIATEIAARGQPDGYTLLWGFSTPLVVNPSLYPNLPFDTEKDFAPVMLLGSAQLLLALHRSLPAASVPELVAALKAKPGQFGYGSAGVGSPNHLAAELFKLRAGVDLVHVPYKWGGPAALALLSGEAKVYFGSCAALLPHVKTGTLRMLAVTGPKRSPETPDLATMQELGYAGFDVRTWYGMLAPGRTPVDIIERLNRELRVILERPEVLDALKREGLEPIGGSAAAFAAHIRTEKALWARVIREAGIKPE